MCAGTPSHSDTPTVLVFQEAVGFACVRDMVRFVEFTKLVYVKNSGNVLEKVCLVVFSLLFFLMVAMLVSALKRYPNCVYVSQMYRYIELCVFICV